MPRAVKTPVPAPTTGTPTHIMLPDGYGTHPYDELLLKGSSSQKARLMLGIPTTGLTRSEFWLALRALGIPTNWSSSERIFFLNESMPIGYSVADARNIIVEAAVQHNFEWLLFIDHDVLVPKHLFVTLNQYMLHADRPLVSGLYFTKSNPAEPLVYRGRGNSYYRTWQLGDTFDVDGCGMGLMLMSVALLKVMWEDAPEYLADGKYLVRKVFETPSMSWIDTETLEYRSFTATEDLSFFTRMHEGGYLAKAGFPKVAKKKYPIRMDTSLFAYHIDNAGIRYPIDLKW